MKRLRHWLAMKLMRVAAKLDDDVLMSASLDLGRIHWDCWEWSHDMGLDHRTQEFKVADKILTQTALKADRIRESLDKIIFNR
jgi:hypothetical protein